MSHQHEDTDVLRTGAWSQCCPPATHLSLRLVPSSPPLLQKVDLDFSKALSIWKSRTPAEGGGDSTEFVLGFCQDKFSSVQTLPKTAELQGQEVWGAVEREKTWLISWVR